MNPRSGGRSDGIDEVRPRHDAGQKWRRNHRAIGDVNGMASEDQAKTDRDAPGRLKRGTEKKRRRRDLTEAADAEKRIARRLPKGRFMRIGDGRSPLTFRARRGVSERRTDAVTGNEGHGDDKR